MNIRLGCLLVAACCASSSAAQSSWRPEVLPVELTVGYAVLPLDLNQDGKLDVVITDSKRYIWLENPTWKVHTIHETPAAKHDNVCFAAHDVDGDSKIDLAIGHDWQFGNSDSGGKIGWLKSPADPRQPWTYFELGSEPTVHRMRWIDWDHNGQLDLVVAPLKGKGSRAPDFLNKPVRLILLTPDPQQPTAPWTRRSLDESLHVTHNLDVVDLNQDGQDELLVASFEGVTHLQYSPAGVQQTRLGSGQEGAAPAIGSSEIRLGKLGTGTSYLATIEPWHGDHVVVYTPPQEAQTLWTRHVLDDQLKWGHAVACADLDGDTDQELVIGVRDDQGSQHRCGVRVYDPQAPQEGKWQRQLIEPGQVAVEDLAVADFDGDGDTDIVAVGRATKNAVIYWNER